MTALLQLLNTRVRIELNRYIIISTFIPKGQSDFMAEKDRLKDHLENFRE